ncbi:MAG TPA: hypothetical protein VFL94_17400 [Actinomycetales bacterium]|nr:hypothetical protein [Actinomycetales bacterium]
MNLKKSQPAPDEVSESPTGGSPVKLLLIGGGVVGLAAAGALAFVLLSGGDEPVSAASGPVPVPTATAPTEAATPTSSASIPTYAAKNARDPFKALVTQAAAAKSVSSATTSPAAWTPPPAPASTSSTTSPTTSRTTLPSKTTTTAPEPTIPYDVDIVVLSEIVDGTTVKIYADDKPYTLKVGEASSGPLRLQSVDTTAQSAVVQYGDVLVTLPLRQVIILQQQ